MGFLTPWFLAGAAAVGLPIFVHLLQQYQQTPVKFSSLMFFEKRTQSSVKHRRLKHLLLFALRCLFILLLVLAFARPYISTSGAVSLNSAKTVVFALDNSLSMRRGGAFAKAKQQALDEIAKLGDADRGQVVTFGGPAKLVTDMTGDKQTLRAAVSALEPGDDASSYAEIARVLRSTSEGYKTNVDAHVFTDLQKSSLPPSFADLRLNDGTKLNVHNVGEGFIPNWTIEAVDAPRRVFDTKKVRTLATIASWGGDVATRTVSLVANGKTVETKQVKIAPGGRAVAEFLTLDVPYGLTKCEIRIDAADAFPQDDHWFFSVERADPKPALLLHSANDSASTLYVKTALESATDAAFTVDSRTPDQAANVDMSKFAFAILADAGPLPRSLEDNLEKFVQGGGSVMISLGRYATPGRNIPVAGFPVTQIHTITGDEPVQTVAQIDTSYPAFSLSSSRGSASWDSVQIFQYVKLQTPQESPDTRIAARLANGLPLFVDRKIGEGHVLVFASAFDNIANNLPLQPIWLPFLEQTTHEMGGVGSGRGAYRVGSFVELRSVRERNVPVEILGPDGKRMMTLSESSKATNYQFPSEGFFEIRRANGRQELAAVNADRRESDFTVVPPETVELWKNTGIAAKTSAATASGANTREVKSELWWWVLALLAMLAVAESVLGNRHLAGKETA